MAKRRDTVPATVREAVLREFNHKCAVCGAERPHLHHIDEDPANGAPDNLIPLCPNCHLVDQHDASNTIPQAKLRLFRQHKHRYILKPQFNPVFRRMTFLFSIADDDNASQLAERAHELVDLVANLGMGQFYSASLKRLLDPPPYAFAVVIGDDASARRFAAHGEKVDQEYREQLRQAAPEAVALLVEMLDYQPWGENSPAP